MRHSANPGAAQATADIRSAIETITRALGSPSKTAIRIGPLWRKYWLTDGRYHRSKGDIRRNGLKFAWRFRHRDPLTIETVEIERWCDEMALTLTRRHVPPMPATLNRIRATARRFLNWAVEDRRIPYNPIARIAMAEEDNIRQTTIARAGDLEALLAHASRLMKALILSLADSGMRRTEACRLRWDEFDHDTGVVFLRGGRRTKNGRARRPRLTARALAAVLAIPQFCPWVFANEKTGRAFGVRTLARWFEKTVAASGLKGVNDEPITFHTLRHRFAYLCRRKHRLPEVTIMRIGGWLTRAAFDRYGIVDDDEIDEAYARIEDDLRSELAEPRIGPRRASESRRYASSGNQPAKAVEKRNAQKN